jgi:hypothetical protein
MIKCNYSRPDPFMVGSTFVFGWDASQIASAFAYVRLGYDGTDPSPFALPVTSEINNVVEPSILQPWQFSYLHSDGYSGE